MGVQFPAFISRIIKEVLDARRVNFYRRRYFIDETRGRSVEMNAKHADRKLAVWLSVFNNRLCHHPDVILAGDMKLISGCK